MKSLSVIMISIFLASSVFAGDKDIDWGSCIEYKYSIDVSTNVPPFADLAHGTMAKGILQSLTYTPAAIAAYTGAGKTVPTKAELEAVNAAAVTWKADKIKDEKANFADWDDKTKALALVLKDNDEKWRGMFRALSKDIAAVSNSLSSAGYTADDLTAKTLAEWKAAIKAKL